MYDVAKPSFEVIRPIKRLTILAMGRSINDWIAQTYLNSDAFGEVWTLNHGGLMFRHDVLWDMHTEEYIANLTELDRARIAVRRKHLESHDRPIVTPYNFPLKEVIEQTQSDWFNNGMAYMLAAALCCKVEQLFLYGVDFVGPKFEDQRACTMYWLGRLIQSGCRVGGSCKVLEQLGRQTGAQLYGYHEPAMYEWGGVEPKFIGPDYV